MLFRRLGPRNVRHSEASCSANDGYGVPLTYSETVRFSVYMRTVSPATSVFSLIETPDDKVTFAFGETSRLCSRVSSLFQRGARVLAAKVPRGCVRCSGEPDQRYLYSTSLTPPKPVRHQVPFGAPTSVRRGILPIFQLFFAHRQQRQ